MRLLTQAQTMTDVDRESAEAFAAWLLDIGDGTLNSADDFVEIPDGKIDVDNIY